MVLVDITSEEVKALDETLFNKKKVTCSISTGTVLGLFRIKIQKTFVRDAEKRQMAKAKEMLNVKKKD